MQFTLVQGYLYPGHSVLRMHGTPHRTGEELENALLAACARLEIDILTNAVATDVLRFRGQPGNGARAHSGDRRGRVLSGHVGNKGDAVRWGLELGAAVADMGSYQGHGAVAVPYGNPVNWGVLTNGGYQVNSLGLRFSNEVRGYSEQAVEVIAQPGKIAWDVFDEARERPILGFADYEEIRALGGIRKASSLRELAAMMSISPDALQGTNAEVDTLRSTGEKDCWGRRFAGTQPLAAPFCAVKVTGALFHTQGGLVVDAKARVLRKDGEPFPNLFAGGGAARGLSGPSNWATFLAAAC